MPVSLSITVEGLDRLMDKLNGINPRKNTAWMQRAMVSCGLLVQKIAAEEMIIRGGKGPPHPKKLTSRTGTLRRSIRVNRSPLPFAIEIGSDLVYAAIHEIGSRTHPPRPYLGPALDKAAKSFNRIFAKELGKEIAK